MSKEPCLCGAIDCRICGPLQGFPIGWEEEEEDVHEVEIHGVDEEEEE